MANNADRKANSVRALQRTPLDELPNVEAVRIPKEGRKGDGLGCRCAGCRHNHSYKAKSHWRTVLRERTRRAARLAAQH